MGRAALLAALILIASSCAAAQDQSSESPSPSRSPTPQASPLALTITSASFHAGEVGFGYTPVTLGATGGTAPYTWSVSAGVLPGGLSLSSGGSVAGSPTHAGTFPFTVQVADSTGGTATAAESVGIVAALKATLIPACAQHCTVEVGCLTVCGKFGTARSGLPPYTYALKGGYIPKGTTLSGLSLTGTFTAPASYWQFSVVVTDALDATTTISPTFLVFKHISFSGGLCQGYASCNVNLRYSVGIPGTPTVKAAAWVGNKSCGPNYTSTCTAPSFSASVQGGIVKIYLGTTSSYPYESGTFKLTLTDQHLCGAGVHCSATVNLNVNLN